MVSYFLIIITFPYLAAMANVRKRFINLVCCKESLTSSNVVGTRRLPGGTSSRELFH